MVKLKSALALLVSVLLVGVVATTIWPKNPLNAGEYLMVIVVALAVGAMGWLLRRIFWKAK